MDRLTGAADIGELLVHERQIDQAARGSDFEHNYGLILVDLVGFFRINDDFGREIGDKLLIELARRTQILCPDGFVARVEADKFAVLIDGLSQDEVTGAGLRLKRQLNSASWALDAKSVPVKVQVTCVSGPSPFPGETNLLWDAQRKYRAKGRWQLKEEVKELDDLVRRNARKVELSEVQKQTAMSIARHDQLTGALNRLGYEDLRESLDPPYVLAFIDVDHFGQFNKSHGDNWAAGDRVLKGVKRMLDSISPAAIVVRWGGDEFLVCLPGFSDSDAARALTSLLENPNQHLRSGDLPVTFSAGVAVVGDADASEAAMQAAQQCAKEAKDAGRARIFIARQDSKVSTKGD